MAEVLGVFEQAVLVVVLRLRGEGYGRTILKDVQARLDRRVAASAVYATLDRLEAKGLAVSRAGEATPERGGPARRPFTNPRGASESSWRGVRLPLKGRA